MTATGSEVQREREEQSPHRRNDPYLDERSRASRAARPVGDVAPGDAGNHRGDVDGEERGRRGEGGLPGCERRRHGESQHRLQNDDVEGGNGE